MPACHAGDRRFESGRARHYTPEDPPMLRAARFVCPVLAWAFMAGVVLQVFFIGLGLFDGAEYLQLHADFGWTILHLSPLAILVAAFHPIAAVLSFGLAILVARGATSLVGSTEAGTSATRGEWAAVAVVVVILPFLSLSGSPTEA
jgi:hypothetical protein